MNNQNNANTQLDPNVSNEHPKDGTNNLSADLPKENPEDDLYGHAPFAKILAEGISGYGGSDGMVLALYGDWGSGKSTVLNYIKYNLDKLPENEKPTVIRFNPWWFSGHENLAHSFFGQLQAILPAKSEKFGNLGQLLAELAEGTGAPMVNLFASIAELAEDMAGAIDPTGSLPVAGKFASKLLNLAKREPKDVPTLKDEIKKILCKSDKFIVVFVDDIDRLTSEEIRQLFTVIKALADFPNVIYFLALDREVAVRAIEIQTGMPGDSFLEKIIQVPFEMPPVDRVALRSVLENRLEKVLQVPSEYLLNDSDWNNVYKGISPLIRVPRDVERITNTLAVTYPSVRGQVNTVDFIALEILRLILPKLYDIIRSHPDYLTGYIQPHEYLHNGNQVIPDDFLELLLKHIPIELEGRTKAMLEHIFPRLSQARLDSEWLQKQKQNLRACHPDLFPIYFSLTIPPGYVSESGMIALLESANKSGNFRDILLKARNEKRSDGLTKAQAMLIRLMDYVDKDIELGNIPTIIQELLEIGDKLIAPAGTLGSSDFSDVYISGRPVYHLLKHVATDQRYDMLMTAIQSGSAIAVQMWLLLALAGEINESNGFDEDNLLTAEEVDGLNLIWLKRLNELSGEPNFLKHSELARILNGWQAWAGMDDVRKWCDKVTKTGRGLIIFLQGFIQYDRITTAGESEVRIQPRLNTDSLDSYLDIVGCTDRLRELQLTNRIPYRYKEAVSQYLEWSSKKIQKSSANFS